MASDPTQGVEGLRLDQRRPKALDRLDLRKLLRAVHRSENQRDIALLEPIDPVLTDLFGPVSAR